MPPDPQSTATDHDILIRLNENVQSMREEMRQVTANLNTQYADHEARLRVIEAASERQEGANRAFRVLLGAIGIIATIIEPIVLWLLQGNPHG